MRESEVIQDMNLGPSDLEAFQRRALWVGVVGIALCGVGAIQAGDQFYRSYLLGFVFWAGIALGSLAILMLQYLTGGAWGLVTRRLLESATRTLPLIALLFLPILLGIDHLYEWTDPGDDPVLLAKTPYLNVPFFILRAVFYFMAWMLLAHFLNRWSLQQDQGIRKRGTRLELLSGPGLVLYGATMTFASVDWLMSLEPHWFSTVYGLSTMVGQVLTAFAFIIALTVLLSHCQPLSQLITATHWHDLGKLLLAFVLIWAYLAFSEFLIIWSANLPEEIPHFIQRQEGGWAYVGLALILFHFALPFALLLSRDLKRNSRKLAGVALLLLGMRLLDLFWLISPSSHHGATVRLHWLDLAAVAGLGGLWIWTFVWQLRKRPLLPLNDPHLKELAESHGS